ncbi:beta-ketoacyl synthase N-terminal-like domain-containing protein [Yinghuangia seranimata]|uniref:beta-ketoacyl synthase N-terminal-like domain-containing protein n=1 Tax=Yinghuangia seranimata TaxID=408067 RepID=UPI00248CA91C|nr:beta-ketoacyl synthase N-terminal-like domain-containing protein [Yinghuangia seranimata]MDI2125665.1 beta-ketoacyl synthase N-terminal-like domain-containing protein [Yinghuangia seranimata]
MSWDIVGMGAVTCLGDEPAAVHRALCDGRTGVAPLRAFDSSLFRVKHAYEIDDRAVPGQDEPGRATRWLRAAVAAALADAGLPAHVPDVPVIVGTTLRELRSAELWWRDGHPLAPADLHFGRAMREAFGTTETHTVASACAAALYALAMATDLIALGLAETVVVAGTDAITESSFGGLDRVQNPPPQAIRPFARHRRGMVMGEGAVAVVVRASGSHPRPVHARVRAVATNCDAAHATVPDTAGVSDAVRDAHRRAGISARDVDLVVVHGSGTRHNDAVEAGVLRDVFRGVRPGPLVTSVKSGLGHTCGGSGLMSLMVAVLAMRTGESPPIPELTDPTPEARGLRLVAGVPARERVDTAQINAIGLGGINAVAIVGRAA